MTCKGEWLAVARQEIKRLRKLLKLAPVLLLAALPLLAQSASTVFTWHGSTDSSQLVELASINGEPVDQSTGYAGAIQIVNRNFLWLLELPESLGLPNNGYLDCSSPITFGAKEWGTRLNGTPMDGSQAGDWYSITGTTSCALASGTTAISLTEFRQMVAHRYCRYSVCRTYLVDTLEGGSGAVN